MCQCLIKEFSILINNLIMNYDSHNQTKGSIELDNPGEVSQILSGITFDRNNIS